MQPVFRFAPSPNGFLHLGHAFSALTNQQICKENGGKLLLRIEDIDTQRCRHEFASAAIEDLKWLGVDFDAEIVFQSHRRPIYDTALKRLLELELLYPCNCTRNRLDHISDSALQDPDGQKIYDGHCKRQPPKIGESYGLRLDSEKALHLFGEDLSCLESGEPQPLRPEMWGDVIIARKDIGNSYHLAVTADDAAQGITHVVRGKDLQHATAIHVLLQKILAFPTPQYFHHALIAHQSGRKLSKSFADLSLRDLKSQGRTAKSIRNELGFD